MAAEIGRPYLQVLSAALDTGYLTAAETMVRDRTTKSFTTRSPP